MSSVTNIIKICVNNVIPFPIKYENMYHKNSYNCSINAFPITINILCVMARNICKWNIKTIFVINAVVLILLLLVWKFFTCSKNESYETSSVNLMDSQLFVVNIYFCKMEKLYSEINFIIEWVQLRTFLVKILFAICLLNANMPWKFTIWPWKILWCSPIIIINVDHFMNISFKNMFDFNWQYYFGIFPVVFFYRLFGKKFH